MHPRSASLEMRVNMETATLQDLYRIVGFARAHEATSMHCEVDSDDEYQGHVIFLGVDV